MSAVVVPAYLGELSPAQLRGRIVELYEVALCVGMLAAVLADAGLAGVDNNWRWMVGIPAIPGLIMSGDSHVLTPDRPGLQAVALLAPVGSLDRLRLVAAVFCTVWSPA